MAVAYESISTASQNGAASTIVVTKPTGLAEGDLMVAGVLINSTGVETVSNESGWTTFGTPIEAHDEYIKLMWKVATAGDVAAANFTFDFSATLSGSNAFIMRISGASTTTPINAINQVEADNTSTPSLNAAITPSVPDCLLLMIVSATSPTASIASISSFAIATDNPTWTSRASLTNTGGADHCFTVATASRTQTTSTGNSSFSGSGADGSTDWHLYMVAIQPFINVTVSPSIISLVASLVAPVVGIGSVITPSVLSLVSSLGTPRITATSNPWENPASKSNTTWTNPNKTL